MERGHSRMRSMRRMFLTVVQIQLPLWLVTPMMLIVLCGGLGAGYWFTLQTTTPCPESHDVCARFTNLWKAWDLATQKYVDPGAVKPDQMADGAIAGMLNSL